MDRPKPPASLSVDFDNKWAYLRAAGHADWENASSYLPVAAERMQDVLGSLGLSLTVFVVGRDLQSDQDVAAIESFRVLRSVEYANHSMNHLPWLHTLSTEEISEEISGTHDAIRSVLGETSRGFRGPGFSCPAEVLRVLGRLEYRYDASIFPTSMAPIARAVFLARTKLRGPERERAKKLYGGFSAMRHPNRPYRRDIEGDTIWEIPVSVMPFLRTPIHFSYFTFLAGISRIAAKTYLNNALRLHRWTGTPPTLLLHPPDFLGAEDDQQMAYLPGMKLTRKEKLDIVTWGLKRFSESFEVTTMLDQTSMLSAKCTSEGGTSGAQRHRGGTQSQDDSHKLMIG